MKPQNARLVYFSPTHTTKHIVEAVAGGTEITNVIETDLTLQPSENQVFSDSELAIIAVPVYGGKVAPLAVERLKAIRGANTPAVLIVVYGNRAYEKALVQLNTLALQQGFRVIACATFIGEHSFSNEKRPIASGRPDKNDLNLAREFGKQIHEKLEKPGLLHPVNAGKIGRLRQSFFPLLHFIYKVYKLRKSGVPLPKTPRVADKDKCVHCGACAAHCPAQAIEKNDELQIDAKKCIKCCACVKICPHKVRIYDSPLADLLSEYFIQNKKPQILL